MAYLSESELLNLKIILSAENIGSIKARTLVKHFDSCQKVLEASKNELTLVDGFSNTLAENIFKAKSNAAEIEKKLISEQKHLDRLGARIMTIWDEDYPKMLANIYDAPAILYILGEFTPADDYSIAIVGTRSPTTYGKSNANKFAMDFVAKKITVVSGLARGIDTTAHTAALSAGGRTIAVLGSGIDIIYPSENRALVEKIALSGAVITELEPGTKPDAVNFPRRNRIISGLSLGSLIVESGIKGGSLYTADYSLDQNREVFAIPGNINQKSSEGCNLYIQKGTAKLVQNSNDCFTEIYLPWEIRDPQKAAQKRSIPDLDPFEQSIIEHITDVPLHIDEIAQLTSISTNDCLVYLLQLEMKNLIRQVPGTCFVIC